MIFGKLLFLFFHLNSSFKMININRKSYMFMGCDYYIDQRLCIFYNDKSRYCINLKREKGYFTEYDDFIMNINSQSNLTKWGKIERHHLTPKAVPFVVYTNHSYINEYVADKYQAVIEYEMIHNIDRKWSDIKDIVLYEDRWER